MMAEIRDNLQSLVPLHAQELEKYARWYDLEPNSGWGRRAKDLYEQLKARPNPWGIGLWKDEETEKVAKRCAEIFVENFMRCPNDHLIPQDRMCMVEALDDLGDLDGPEAFRGIEEEFGCQIPEKMFNNQITFAEFVDFLVKGQGKNPPERHPRKDLVYGVFALCFIVMLFIGLPFWGLCSAYGDIRDLCVAGWHWSDAAVVTVKLLLSGVALLAVVKIIWSATRDSRTK